MQPTAKTLILDLLSTQIGAPRDGSMPVAALVAAGRLMGIAPNNLRVALARLSAAGLADRDERGRYRLGAAARAVSTRVGSWRRIEARLQPWHGDWIAVHRRRTAERGRSAALRRSARALRLLGFETLEPGLAIRPANLSGGVDAVRDQLWELGLASGSLVTGLSDLDPLSERRARSLWDVKAIRARYAEGRKALRISAGGIGKRSVEEAMVETFRVGGRVLRTLVLDPLLPEPLVPAGERRALLAEMTAYDRLGRSCWAEFLARHGVAHRRAPLDLRVGFERDLHPVRRLESEVQES